MRASVAALLSDLVMLALTPVFWVLDRWGHWVEQQSWDSRGEWADLTDD